MWPASRTSASLAPTGPGTVEPGLGLYVGAPVPWSAVVLFTGAVTPPDRPEWASTRTSHAPITQPEAGVVSSPVTLENSPYSPKAR
ncbi:hypothetical protein NDU88_009006 [Pleurodeles waltl]|uniref:Uncharacterized protein n=1 Tax=Pleurodeles waltl TaxID=8319 RepID=A0AAV7P0Y7_PLEWA|nr:hypothetical protein NDU88_009006 [Pleurodeles waltl]